MKKLKVGLVGCGSIAGYAHFPSYERMKDIVDLVAVADIVPEKAKAAAEKYGVPHWYDSVEALLAAEPDVDYIDVCTWPAAHAPVAIAAAKAGKHVICEKPLAATLEQGLAIEKAVREAGVQFMLAVCTRYEGQSQKFIELRDQGIFGDIYYAKTAYVRSRGVPGGWFTNKAIAGGGPVLDVGVHAIDRTWYFMGRPKPISVTAEISSRIGKYNGESTFTWDAAEKNDKEIFDVEDSACALFRFEGGKSMIAETSWTINGRDENYSTIYGTKAGCDFHPLTIYAQDENGKFGKTAIEVEGVDSYEWEIRHFIDCLNTGKKPISPIEDAVTVQRMLDGIYRSAEAHAEVKI
jgi:predicted dehydrogenase